MEETKTKANHNISSAYFAFLIVLISRFEVKLGEFFVIESEIFLGMFGERKNGI